MAVKRSALSGALKASKQSAPKPKGTKTTLHLDDILDRPHGDSRPLNPQHVEELANSIAAVGLIQPLAVDSEGNLLAGGHRRAALLYFRESNPHGYADKFPLNLIPVRQFDFSAADVPDQAIAIEAAENEKRRDYTPAEVRALADRLVEAGYRNTKGKPKKGQKALTPALMSIVGKSRRTVQRYLEPETDNAPSGTLSKDEKFLRELEAFELRTTDETAAALATQLRERLSE